MLLGTLTGKRAGLNRQSLVGKLCEACGKSIETRSLRAYLRDNFVQPGGEGRIVVVATAEGEMAIILYNCGDLSYGEPVSHSSIDHQLGKIAEEFDLTDVVFCSTERKMGKNFLSVSAGAQVSVYNSEHYSLDGCVTEIL